MHIMVHCKSCESSRLLKTALTGRDSFFELLSRLPIKCLKDFCHQVGLLLFIAVHQSHCLYNDFHLDDLKTAV